MNKAFEAYIQLGRSIIEAKGLRWEIETDQLGKALKGAAWNLTEMTCGVGTPAHYLSHIGYDEPTVKAINQASKINSRPPLTLAPLSRHWSNLIKAIVVEQLFIKKNSTSHVANSIIRPMRVLATVVEVKEPWEVTADDIAKAISVARQIQSCGKLSDLIAGITKTILDQNHLTDAGPLYHAVASVRLNPGSNRKARFLKSANTIRHDLEERKRSERLPEKQAFWELVRIVMTETPMTFMDELRFAAVRLLIATGFRIGEATLLPLDWRRDRTHLTPSGRSVSDYGGIGRSTMIRHFRRVSR